jgi:hypothetical protein
VIVILLVRWMMSASLILIRDMLIVACCLMFLKQYVDISTVWEKARFLYDCVGTIVNKFYSPPSV